MTMCQTHRLKSFSMGSGLFLTLILILTGKG